MFDLLDLLQLCIEIVGAVLILWAAVLKRTVQTSYSLRYKQGFDSHISWCLCFAAV